MNDHFEILREYFANVDEEAKRTGEYWDTDEYGWTLSSSLVHLHYAFNRLLEGGVISSQAPLGEAGGKDARVSILIAAVFDIPAICIEWSPERAQRARMHIANLSDRLGRIPVQLVEGDFTQDAPYIEASAPFEGIGTFYNYVDNHNGLASKIVRHSPPGTVLLYYTSTKGKIDIDLTWEQTLELFDPPNSGKEFSRDTKYLQVYRK